MNGACRGSWRSFAFREADTCRAVPSQAVDMPEHSSARYAARHTLWAMQAPGLCLAHHAEPQTVSVLSVDAWSDGMGGWQWNSWRCVGAIPRAWLRLSTRRLLRLLREEDFLGLGSVGRVLVEDDGYNVCIQERSGCTVLALAYGDRQ